MKLEKNEISRAQSIFITIFGVQQLRQFIYEIYTPHFSNPFCLFFSTVSAQKVGLVLSGGGAKGLTHIGIIRALEENNIPIDYITGTSMGAIVGSLYAMGYSRTIWKSLSNRKISNDGTRRDTGKIHLLFQTESTHTGIYQYPRVIEKPVT